MITIFIYNILLLILYTFSMTFAFINYTKKKEPLFLIFFALMASFILDNTIIYMTEFLESFAVSYNQLSMSLPIIKTAIFMLNHIFCLLALLTLGSDKFKRYQTWLFIILITWMIAVPFAPHSAFTVWLYYLPNQLFLAYMGFYALHRQEYSKQPKVLFFLGWLFIISSALILLEDSYVIFNIDSYSNLALKIYNRNFSEDCFSIVLSSFIIYLSFRTNEPVIEVVNEVADEENNYFSLFCESYHLTQREEEVLYLLLDHCSNQKIADELYLSIGTVKTHVHNIYVKLDINKRSSLFDLFNSDQHP